MTALDGYPMAQQGRGGVALSISAVSSFFGSLIAIGGIILFAPALAQWSLAFGPAEYFALMVFAIACLGSMMAQNPLKSFLSALIGLSLATVGVDANTGVYRFTFDSVHLSDGVQFIVVVIGLFSVSEILLMLEHTSSGQTLVRKTGRMLFNAKEGAQCVGATLRSSVIGFFVGILPGAGATIASAITYMTEKKLSGNSDSFGKGDIRGVAAPEAANNASACGSFIPMLTLGVPGSGTTAVMMGALTLYNITPGPAMFTEQPDIVWGLIAALLIANVMLLVMNIPLIGLFTRMLTIPLWFPGPGHRRRLCGWGVRGAQHHLRPGVDGAARRAGLHSAQDALPDVAADFRVCAGGNAGAEPAPRPLHQQRQHGDPVGEQRNEDPAGNGDYGDCRAAGAALDPPTPAQTAAGYRLISPSTGH